MNVQETMKYKTQLVWDSVRSEKKPERIPHMNNYWTWKITDAGYKLSEATHDNDKMYDVIKQWLERYPEFDILYETGNRNPLLIEDAVGINQYMIDDNANIINVLDQCHMAPDEYDELADNLLKFYWTKGLPRRSSTLQNVSKEEQMKMLANGVKEYDAFVANQARIFQLIKDHGMPRLSESAVGMNGAEYLFNYLRGIKGFSIDMRRQYSKVKETCAKLDKVLRFDYDHKPGLHMGMGDRGETFAFDIYVCMLVHTVLNPKQFEDLFWPTLRYMGDVAEKYDKIAFIFQEGTGDRFWDMFRDLPDKRFAYYPEQDDLYKVKEALPNITPCGGFPQALLAGGTQQECKDMAKKLIDELGCDGRYILGANKMMSFPGDAKRENIRAVCEFVDQYKIG